MKSTGYETNFVNIEIRHGGDLLEVTHEINMARAKDKEMKRGELINPPRFGVK